MAQIQVPIGHPNYHWRMGILRY